MLKKLILWFEDEPKETIGLSTALQKDFRMCSAEWSTGPQHSISAGIRYLLEAVFGYAGKKREFPDLLLLDSQLPNDADRDSHLRDIATLCGGATTELFRDCERAIREGNGGAVLAFIGTHIRRQYPELKVVYASKFGVSDIRENQGGAILQKFPGILNGYFWKKADPELLMRKLFDILNDPKRGMSLKEIRGALHPKDADFLLGPEADAYPWSNAYRLALTDLVRAGGDKAGQYGATPGFRRYVVESDKDAFTNVLRSHKNLPRALILAERGSGKEGFARALHNMWYSHAANAPFVTVNVGGVPPWSAGIALQLRLFGGQQNQEQEVSLGCVPNAWNGTLLLDELGDAQRDVQDTLLRLIQEGEYEPALWNRQVWAAHCCFIGSTNRDLWSGHDFRLDVADRLAMHVVRIPPLCDVKEDLPIWMEKIARQRASAHNGTSLPKTAGMARRIPAAFEFAEVAANVLQGYDWPGNIRELTHAIRRMQMRCAGEPEIQLDAVVTETSRLKQIQATARAVSMAGLPTDQAQLQMFVQGAAEDLKRRGRRAGKSEIARYASSVVGKPVQVHQLRAHFERHFGSSGLDDALRSIASAAGTEVWGGNRR